MAEIEVQTRNQRAEAENFESPDFHGWTSSIAFQEFSS